MVAFYALTFIPLLLITLVIHELGHLLAAKLCGIKVGAFQIGVGKRLFTFHTGRTHVLITPQTANHYPSGHLPVPGDLIHLHVQQDDTGRYHALGGVVKVRVR